MEELINELTHIRGNGSQSWVDLICTNQSFLIDSGILPSLDPNTKHNINFHSLSPHSYKRRIWDYKKAKIDDLRNELTKINWNSLFHHLSVDEMALV